MLACKPLVVPQIVLTAIVRVAVPGDPCLGDRLPYERVSAALEGIGEERSSLVDVAPKILEEIWANPLTGAYTIVRVEFGASGKYACIVAFGQVPLVEGQDS